jgi:hypothetical protein
VLGLVDRWSSDPGPVVDLDEDPKRDPRRALVAVGQRVVLGRPDDQDRGLVDEVGVELRVAEPGCGCVQSRVGDV